MQPFPHPLFARGGTTEAVTSWLFPGSGGFINTGGYGWSGTGNLGADDGSRATAVSTGGVSNYLRASNFNFAGQSIPSGATITGIEAKIARIGGGVNGNDSEVILADYTDFDPLSLNRARPSTWGASEAVISYGGDADVWGLTPTKAMLESSNFALLLKVTALSGNSFGVNYVQLRAHYYY